MHTATMLFSTMLDVEVGGRPAQISDIFPRWQPHDRFGILIDSPLGGLGATHLIHAATVAFYDAMPERRAKKPVYPEIYAIHIGGDHGAHAVFDFWPARKEVIVPNDPREILGAINDRAITRLALPDRHPRDIDHRPGELGAALERITTAVIYDASGRVSDPDFTIRGTDTKTEYNPRTALRSVPVPTDEEVEKLSEYRSMLVRRRLAVTDQDRAAAQQRRDANRIEDMVQESYRFISTEDSLRLL